MLYLYTALIVFISSGFIFADNAGALQIFIASAYCMIWGAICYLNSKRHKYTFHTMALAFLPIAFFVLSRWYARVQFVFEHGGMDCPGCNGSPLAFLIGAIAEAIIFFPGMIGLIIVYKRQNAHALKTK